VVAVNDLARPYAPLECALHFTDVWPRVAIFVSRDSHCLYDLLARQEGGELEMEIPLIVSKHEDLRRVADRFEIPFHVFAVNGKNKAQQEAAELRLLRQHRVDTVVLARYMQILSNQFVAELPNQVINIHHSFLPAFVGARPYHQAYDRGVKIVGATSHYVTADLDEGPIIAQDVMAVSHQDTVADLVRKGKDLEKIVLARAVWAHVRRRVLTYRNKTVVFQ
jgi:formyltetrahydrofolate deformylase